MNFNFNFGNFGNFRNCGLYTEKFLGGLALVSCFILFGCLVAMGWGGKSMTESHVWFVFFISSILLLIISTLLSWFIRNYNYTERPLTARSVSGIIGEEFISESP